MNRRRDSAAQQQQYHRGHHRRRLSRLLPLPVLLALAVAPTATVASSMPALFPRAPAAAFLPFFHGGRQRGLASLASTAATAAATTQPSPPLPKQPAPAPPKTLALGTDAGRALLKRVWGVESAADVKVVPLEEWRAAAERHRADMLQMMGGSTKHDSNHPIYNFLFEYYHFKPQALLEYSPGVEAPTAFLLPPNSETAAHDAPRLLAGKAVRVTGLPGVDESGASAVMWVPPPLGSKGWTEKHVTSLRFGREVLRASADRPPIFYCYGAHEWAMLYQPPGASPPHKYQDLPLRISQQVLNDYVESKPIRCTHYDAFRFFTPEARPLNVYGADLAKRNVGQPMHEQPGCLHANMDLFKWALKLGPYAPSELLGEALHLAVQCRVLDMRASPYDLSAMDPSIDFGHPIDPVRIETEEGRREYAVAQQQRYEKGLPLRKRILAAYDMFFELAERGFGE